MRRILWFSVGLALGWLLLIAAGCAAPALAAPAPRAALVEHVPALRGPVRVAVIARVYPDLHRRELRREPVSWEHLRDMTAARWLERHPAARREATLRWLDSRQSAAACRTIAHMTYPEHYWALDIINTGESGWWVGAVNPDSGAGGIGQALPPSKMEVWARAAGYKNPARIYTSCRMQLRWEVEGYAPAVWGSIEAAARQWSAGGRNGRTW